MDYQKTFEPEKSSETKNHHLRELIVQSGVSILSGAVFGLGHALAVSLYLKLVSSISLKN